MVLALGLATAVPRPLRGEEAAAKEWIGQRSGREASQFPAQGCRRLARPRGEDRDLPRRPGQGRLARPEGRGGAIGWADAGQVVPVDQAVEFFSDAIKASSRPAELRHAGHRSCSSSGRTPSTRWRIATRQSGSIPRMPSPTASGRGPGGNPGLRQGHRRFQRGDPPDARKTRRLPRSRRRPDVHPGFRSGHRRFQRGDPARSQGLVRPSSPAPPPGCRGKRTTRRSPTSTRPSASTPRMPTPICCGPRFAARRANSSRPSPTSPRSSSSIPRRRWPTRPAAPAGGT